MLITLTENHIHIHKPRFVCHEKKTEKTERKASQKFSTQKNNFLLFEFFHIFKISIKFTESLCVEKLFASVELDEI